MTEFGELFKSTEEQIEPIHATIKGTIPNWLNGSLIRSGPGLFDLGKEFVLNHWCDGFCILCKFDIRNGEVTFTKKFLQSDAYKKATMFGRPIYTEFGTQSYPDPSKNIFSRVVSNIKPELTDNNQANLFKLHNGLFAASETHNIRHVIPDSLSTGDKIDLNKLANLTLLSSHILQDDDGNGWTIGTTLTTGFKYQILQIPKPNSNNPVNAFENSKIIATIPSRWKSCVSYYHSFGISQNFIILIEQPMLINGVKLIASQVKSKAMRDCIEWNPHSYNRFYLIEKKSGKVNSIKYKAAKPFFIFHHVNAYENDCQLIIDVIAHDSPEIIECMCLNKLRNSEFNLNHKSEFRRFVLPLADNIQSYPKNINLVLGKSTATAIRIDDWIEVTSENSFEPGFELPAINQKYLGKNYRYCYGSGLYDKSIFRNSIVKLDLKTKEVKTWYESDSSFGGEVQFISKPDSVEEDDGILLCAVTDLRPKHPDFLLILDARTLQEIARAEITVHVPNVIHGVFIPY